MLYVDAPVLALQLNETLPFPGFAVTPVGTAANTVADVSVDAIELPAASTASKSK
jgi:hypothetical protein